VPRNTYRPSSEGTFLVHTPITSAVRPRIQAKTQAGEISLLWLIAGRALMGLGSTLILAALIGTTLFGCA
jgi:hypothetical protein